MYVPYVEMEMSPVVQATTRKKRAKMLLLDDKNLRLTVRKGRRTWRTKEKPKGESVPLFIWNTSFYLEHINILPNGVTTTRGLFLLFFGRKQTNHPSLEDPIFSQTF